MRAQRRTIALVMSAALATGLMSGSAALAAKSQAVVSDAQIADVQRLIDDQRFLEAAQGIDQAIAVNAKDPRIRIMSGELALARGALEPALAEFRAAASSPAVAGRALQGQGIALARLGRTQEAIRVLESAVKADPQAGRAWSALGAQYDRLQDWPKARAAHDQAVLTSGSPQSYNNRGYSRLLQMQLDDAVADFVKALQGRPDFPPARTNLRLAMAMRGDYDRSVQGGSANSEESAALLNNAGFAAGLRGDYAEAEKLLLAAMKTRGQYYDRAAANLDLVRSLKAQNRSANP